MKALIVLLGLAALILAAADFIHGQHNGDVHRFYIHLFEFVFSFSFLSALEIQAFRLLTKKRLRDCWLATFCLSAISFLAGVFLFAGAGGSAHGDGGPIAVSLALVAFISMFVIPISGIGFLVQTFLRKRKVSSTS